MKYFCLPETQQLAMPQQRSIGNAAHCILLDDCTVQKNKRADLERMFNRPKIDLFRI